MNETERRTALLANPHSRSDVDHEIDVPVRFVTENRLSLLLRNAGVRVPGIDTIARQLDVLTDELADVADAFERADVRFLLIKFPDLPKRHRDLDILVFDGVETAHRALTDMGYRLASTEERYKRGYERSRDDVEVSIDLHEEIAWWGNVHVEREPLWQRRTTRTVAEVDVPVPGPVDELLIAAASNVFGEIQTNLFEVLHASDVLDRQPVNGVRLLDRGRDEGWEFQCRYFCGVCDAIYETLYGETIFGVEDDRPTPIEVLPYRYPVPNILAIRGRRIATILQREGPRPGARFAKGHVLETLQLGLDFVRVRTGLPNHPVLNMRRWV